MPAKFADENSIKIFNNRVIISVKFIGSWLSAQLMCFLATRGTGSASNTNFGIK
jgi:hypothetical protein